MVDRHRIGRTVQLRTGYQIFCTCGHSTGPPHSGTLGHAMEVHRYHVRQANADYTALGDNDE